MLKKQATNDAAMAKMAATGRARAIVDTAMQMAGGRGVNSGGIVEQNYREIRTLRIYDGATKVQQVIIARELMKGSGCAG